MKRTHYTEVKTPPNLLSTLVCLAFVRCCPFLLSPALPVRVYVFSAEEGLQPKVPFTSQAFSPL
jgi:hypothetical protein